MVEAEVDDLGVQVEAGAEAGHSPLLDPENLVIIKVGAGGSTTVREQGRDRDRLPQVKDVVTIGAEALVRGEKNAEVPVLGQETEELVG